ncbi:helix-turn-helix domain-containing protein [Sphingomonas aerolata]|uniref:helix-turn-helix domain-containing protein n=1 Tax=Sphingomonas aerolata TaxID=185951 RepID=UPI002FE3390A
MKNIGANAMQPVTVSIADAVALTGLSQATLYRLIARNELDAVKVGRRRLVRVDSMMKLIGA